MVSGWNIFCSKNFEWENGVDRSSVEYCLVGWWFEGGRFNSYQYRYISMLLERFHMNYVRNKRTKSLFEWVPHETSSKLNNHTTNHTNQTLQRHRNGTLTTSSVERWFEMKILRQWWIQYENSVNRNIRFVGESRWLIWIWHTRRLTAPQNRNVNRRRLKDRKRRRKKNNKPKKKNLLVVEYIIVMLSSKWHLQRPHRHRHSHHGPPRRSRPHCSLSLIENVLHQALAMSEGYQSFGAYIQQCVKLLCNTKPHIPPIAMNETESRLLRFFNEDTMSFIYSVFVDRRFWLVRRTFALNCGNEFTEICPF